MTIDGVEYKQIFEKHYKSCEGCSFENKIRSGCTLKDQTVTQYCEHKIWVKA